MTLKEALIISHYLPRFPSIKFETPLTQLLHVHAAIDKQSTNQNHAQP